MKIFFVTTAIICTICISCVEQQVEHYSAALTPEESLKRFTLDEKFTIDIFAAEPFVLDPVEMTFDESGNIYVVEMPDYPTRPADGTGTGNIRLLKDTNGDGRIDSAVIFADGILEASSVLPWKTGLIVAAAPEIFYLQDTNNDNKADTKQLLFTGFFRNNSEYQVNNLRFSIDNWIYAANFGQEGHITSPLSKDTSSLSIERGDFRFRLDNGKFEAVTGRAQFGNAHDVWGHRFTSENSIHIAQPLIPWKYVHRHPWLPWIEFAPGISDHEQLMFQQTVAPYWRQERTKQRNENYKRLNIDRTEYADDHFTGACATTLYAGDAFPEEYYNNIFTNDVAGGLVHRDIITDFKDSVPFIAKRAGNEKANEFLASTDPWFRPVNLTMGPDGSLYVIDMYRQHIEGPDFIPEALKKDMDFNNGKEYGRIYRITPKNRLSPQKVKPDLRHATTAELVQLLTHRNQWWSLQGQKLLLERQDKSSVEALKKLFSSHIDPVARLHALFALEGLGSLDAKIVKQAMTDENAGVREVGVRLSELFPENFSLLKKAVNDSSARVALQAVLSIGEFPAEKVLPVFADVLESRGKDLWFRSAVLSSIPGSSMEFFELLVKQGFFKDELNASAADFLKDFSFVIKKRNIRREVEKLAKMFAAGSHP